MYTPSQVAKRANLHSNTVRNYSTEYADLLSPGARGDDGPRLYTDEDVDTICTIAALRKTGMLPAAVMAQLLADGAPPVVDAEATQSPQAASTALQTAEAVQSSIQVAYNALQSQIEALERQQRRQLWTHGVAFYLGMVTMGIIFYFVWWLVNGI